MAIKVVVILLLVVIGGLLANKLYSYQANYKERKLYTEMQISLAERMEAKIFESPNSQHTMPYLLYVPEDYRRDSSRKLPIVLALHSGRGRGDDNLTQLDMSTKFLMSDMLQELTPTFVLAPQAGEKTHWVNYDSFSPPFINYDQDLIPQSENLKAAIKILKKVIHEYGIDKRRVYITGISMGGEGVWDAITYYPELFAAAIPLNGAGDPDAVHRVKNMPIRFFHGSDDTITPVENSRALHAALNKAPNNAVYREFAGAKHDIRTLVYSREIFSWMLAQIKVEP